MTPAALLGHWVHAHEQDRAGVKVFVPAAQALPPSRGRQRLHFRPDGGFDEAQPGADDRGAPGGGTYVLDGSRLVLQRGGAGPVAYEAECSGDGQRLQLRRC